MNALLRFGSITLAALALSACSSLGGDKATTPQGLFDRHIAATYGSGGLDTHTSVSSTGKLTIDSFGISAPIVLNQMTPASTSLKVEIPGALVRSGCHDGKCWDQQPGQGLSMVSGSALELALQRADYYQFAHMADYYQSLEILPAEDGAENDTVRATRENGTADEFHFSKETGLLMSATTITEGPQGTLPVTANYSDFRETQGILLPMQVEQVTSVVTLKINLEQVTFDQLSATDFSI